MITAHEIYWITRATPIKMALMSIVVVGLVVIAAIVIYAVVNQDGDFTDYREGIKADDKSGNIGAIICFSLTFFLVLLFISVPFIPSTRDLVIIKVLPDILNNKDMKNIAPNTAKVIDTQLHKWIIQNLPKNVEPDQIIK